MGFGDENEQEVLDFQESMEQNAPYAQYLSTAHGLFSTVYAICCIPGMKDRTILTENNNPGIGKVLRVSFFFYVRKAEMRLDLLTLLSCRRSLGL